MSEEAGWVKIGKDNQQTVYTLGGAWTIDHASSLGAALASGPKPGLGAIFDLGSVTTIDSAGAWLLLRTAKAFSLDGSKVEWRNLSRDFQPLVERVREAGDDVFLPPAARRTFTDWVADLGQALSEIAKETVDLVAFFGEFTLALGQLLTRPARLRTKALVTHIEQAGVNAVPIISLISFLIGMVLAYQGADQLRRFGAQIFTVDLVGISVLREMGILLTAIVVAGRSGSAFTAQIGTMQVNEEVDALRTLGLDPMEILVLPRVLALVIALPLLTFLADMMGILGGGLMVVALVDIDFSQYLNLLKNSVTTTHFWVGMVKAPVFAMLISLVGCFEGLRVSGSAESVGLMTTRAVVEGIFLVIVFDALFSIAFSVLGV